MPVVLIFYDFVDGESLSYGEIQNQANIPSQELFQGALTVVDPKGDRRDNSRHYDSAITSIVFPRCQVSRILSALLEGAALFQLPQWTLQNAGMNVDRCLI